MGLDSLASYSQCVSYHGSVCVCMCHMEIDHYSRGVLTVLLDTHMQAQFSPHIRLSETAGQALGNANNEKSMPKETGGSVSACSFYCMWMNVTM